MQRPLFTPVARDNRQPLFTPAARQTEPLFAPASTTLAVVPAPQPSAPAPVPAPPLAPPSMALPLQFALKLQGYLASQVTMYTEAQQRGAPADPAEAQQLQMKLLEEYEECCGKELKRLKVELQRSDQAAAAALAAECELLRGERNSWNLLRWLYSDWAERQQPAPPFPPPPEDWGRSLRELGPEVGLLAAPRAPRAPRTRTARCKANSPPLPVAHPRRSHRRCSIRRRGCRTWQASTVAARRRRRASPSPRPTRACACAPFTTRPSRRRPSCVLTRCSTSEVS